jgi:hypothetical protein
LEAVRALKENMAKFLKFSYQSIEKVAFDAIFF